MSEKLGPAFAVSRVGTATKYGGTTYTLKAHFHTSDHAETVRRLLEELPLPPGPYPEQAAAQAELIDLQKLEQAMAWMGLSAPSGEMLGWWVGREVNRLLDAVLRQRTEVQRARSADPAIALRHRIGKLRAALGAIDTEAAHDALESDDAATPASAGQVADGEGKK